MPGLSPCTDSFILAVARIDDAMLWIQDKHFQGLAGVGYIVK